MGGQWTFTKGIEIAQEVKQFSRETIDSFVGWGTHGTEDPRNKLIEI